MQVSSGHALSAAVLNNVVHQHLTGHTSKGINSVIIGHNSKF